MSSETAYKVPENLYEQITKTYDAAVESGDLVFTPTTSNPDTVDGINYIYSLIPSLKEKPKGDLTSGEKEPVKEGDIKSEKPFDPFDPPSPPLTVLSSYGPEHAVVLNKFAVVPHHFLLITQKPYPQSSPLRPEDLAASFRVLAAVNKQSRSRHIGFFNCGAASGASVNHRHIQFLKLPDGFTPWPDHLAEKHRANYKEGSAPLALDKTPFFQHYLVPVDKAALLAENDEELEDHLGFRYSTLLSRVLTAIRNIKSDPSDPSTLDQYTSAESGQKKKTEEISYNLVFTEEWILAVPRTAPDFVDETAGVSIGINAVGTVGLLLAKNDQELDYIKEKGPLSIVTGVSLPLEGREEDTDYDY